MFYTSSPLAGKIISKMTYCPSSGTCSMQQGGSCCEHIIFAIFKAYIMCQYICVCVCVSGTQILHSGSCTEEKLASVSVTVGVCTVTPRHWEKQPERTEWSQRFVLLFRCARWFMCQWRMLKQFALKCFVTLMFQRFIWSCMYCFICDTSYILQC